MCAVDYCEPWEVRRASYQRARRAYGCVECGRRIAVGERYHKVVGLLDGYWSTHRTCQHCDALGGVMGVLCNGYPIGGLYDELTEHWREGYASVRLGRWVVAMKHGWRAGAAEVPTGCAEHAGELLRAWVRS